MRMAYTQRRSLFGLICLGLFVIVGASSTPTDPSASQPANTELICPTENTGDCYPRIFEPTEEFQLIKEGQDIPPGLHVRLNINTGKKEARLNIPIEGEDDLALEGIPIEQAMVVVDQPETEKEPIQIPIPANAPPYEAAGKIQPPPPTGGDAGSFGAARLSIITEGPDFDTSLDDLSELAHDIYYGVELVKDQPTVEKLLCYALGSGSEKFPAKENKRDYKAASILAKAIQNNPTALQEIAKMGKVITHPTCHLDKKANGETDLVALLKAKMENEEDPDVPKADITLMSGLMKEPAIRDQVLKTGGIGMLLQMWMKEGDPWDGVRKKIAQAITDNLLDESLGATTGIWPTQPFEEECETIDGRLDDGCWEHYIEVYLKKSPKAEWAVDFLKVLREQRAKLAEKISHGEL